MVNAKDTKAHQKRTPMRRRYGSVDLSDWELSAWNAIQGKLADVLRKATRQAINLAMQDEDTGISLPVFWAPNSDGHYGPAVKDPLTLHLTVALGADGDSHPIYEFNLRNLVEEDLEMMGVSNEGLRMFAKALRELADTIDAAPHED